MFTECFIRDERVKGIDKIIENVKKNHTKYEAIGKPLNNIPWYFIAAIHNQETSMSFNKHLHNGDSLTSRTVKVPKGRPKSGNPPFTWEVSATDALMLKDLQNWTDWSVPGLMYKLEEYNGWGYRLYPPEVLSPYLWSFSKHYIKGKYIEYGKWSDEAESDQCGSAVLLKRMNELGIFNEIGEKNVANNQFDPNISFNLDLEILDRYQKFSAEIIRLSILLIGVIGYLIENNKDFLRNSTVLIIFALCFLGISSFLSLLHRYFSTDTIANHLLFLRNGSSNIKKIRDKQFRLSGKLILYSVISIACGVTFIVLGFVIEVVF